MKAYGTMILTGLICAFLVGASFFFQRSVERDLTGQVNRAINHAGSTGLKISWLDVILKERLNGSEAAIAEAVPAARILKHHNGITEQVLVHDLKNPQTSLPQDSPPSLKEIALDDAEDAQSLRFTRINGELHCQGVLPAPELRAMVETLAGSLAEVSGDITHDLNITRGETQGWWWKSLEDFVPKYFESVSGNAILQCSMEGLIARGKLSEGASASQLDQLLRVAAPATGKVDIDLNALISDSEPSQTPSLQAPSETDNTESLAPPSPLVAPMIPAKLLTEIVGHPITFGANFSGLEKAEREKILQAATELEALGEDMRAIIKGYSDYEGNSNYRKNLAHQRAENVKLLLIETGLPATAFTVVTEETDPGVGDDGQSSRRVEILKIVEEKPEE